MKCGSMLFEAVAILAVAAGLGTAFHKLRPDAEKRIRWVGDYPNWWKVLPPPAPRTHPAPAKIHLPPQVPELSLGPEPAEPSMPKKKASPDPLAPVTVPVPEAAPLPEKERSAGPRAGLEIAIDEVQLLQKEGVPFIDARRSRFYLQGHIPGARSLPVWEADLDQRISTLLTEVPQDAPVVVYCSSGDCEDSHMLAQKLEVAGYKDLKVFRGGFPEWQKRGLPVEVSSGGGTPPPGGEEEEK
jgi:3-mercaptopyruvate sulfurtransferase SseA